MPLDPRLRHHPCAAGAAAGPPRDQGAGPLPLAALPGQRGGPDGRLLLLRHPLHHQQVRRAPRARQGKSWALES